MNLIDENGKWIFLRKNASSLKSNKRAEFLDALKNVIIDMQGLAPDLASLEVTEDENKKKRIKARLASVRMQLDFLENHL